jgi:hypothetical protein
VVELGQQVLVVVKGDVVLALAVQLLEPSLFGEAIGQQEAARSGYLEGAKVQGEPSTAEHAARTRDPSEPLLDDLVAEITAPWTR